MTTTAEIFAEIQQHLQDNPAKVQGLNATLQFDLSGEDGGAWSITVADGTATVAQGYLEKPQLTVLMSAGDFAALVAGTLDPMGALIGGKMKLRGDVGLAMRLQPLLQ
jgi:putative sterol carrier protein